MRRLGLLAAVGALVLLVGGCQTVGDAIQSVGTDLTTARPADASDVAAVEATFTAAAGVATVWAKSGHETPAQAQIVENYRTAIYANIVVARTAVANGDSAAAAVALNLARAGLTALTGYVGTNGGGKG